METSSDVSLSRPVMGEAASHEIRGLGNSKWRIVSRAEDGIAACATLSVKGLNVTLTRRLGHYGPAVWFLKAPPIFTDVWFQESSFEVITKGVESLLAKDLWDKHQSVKNRSFSDVTPRFQLQVRPFDSHIPHLWVASAPHYLLHHVLTAKTPAEAETAAVAALGDELRILSGMMVAGHEQRKADVRVDYANALDPAEMLDVLAFVKRCSHMKWRLLQPNRVSDLDHYPISSATLSMQGYNGTIRMRVERRCAIPGASILWRVILPLRNHARGWRHHYFEVNAVDFESAVRLAAAELQKSASEFIAQGRLDKWDVRFSCWDTNVIGQWRVSAYPFLPPTLIRAASRDGAIAKAKRIWAAKFTAWIFAVGTTPLHFDRRKQKA